MKKTIYTLFLLMLFLSFGFASQTSYSYASANNDVFEINAFRLVRQVSSDGRIGMAYIFPVNSAVLSEQGYNVSQIATFKFYLTSYVNTLAKNNKEKAVDGMQVSSAQYYSDVDGIGFSLVFDSLEVQSAFFGTSDSQEDSSSSNQNSYGFFIKTTELKTVFPFSQNSAGDLKMVVLMAMSSWANDQNLTDQEKQNVQQILSDSVFIYDFGSTQTSLKSEIMYEDENFHHNVFIKTFDQLESSPEITFYTQQINYPVWYIFALSFVVVAMAVAYFVLKRRKKKS